MPTSTMTALAVTEIGRTARLIEMPRPAVDDDSVIIQTHFSGVSIGTEMWIAMGRRKDYGDPPFVNGYQVTGRIVEAGSKVTSAAVGDLVAAFVRGAHAPFVKASGGLIHRLPDEALARVASLFVQPSVAANALNMAGVNTGDTVLVVGQGLIGQATAQLARLRGAYVIASDIAPDRLAVARQHCADWVIDAAAGVKVSEVLKTRFPNGVDVVIESTGFQALLDDALACATFNGRFVFEGFYPDTVTYTFALPHGKQLRAFYPVFIGPAASREGVIRLMGQGALKIDPLISHALPWRESEAIYNQLFTRDRDKFNGIVFDWRA